MKKISLVLSALVAACGGGKSAGPTGPSGANRAPTALFSAATAATVGTPVAFDASGSTDPDGDTLVYRWSFGDDKHGGASQLAHIFAAPGTRTVTLTVSDGKGGTHTATQSIVVAAAPAPNGTAAITVRVRSGGTSPVPGATVQVLGGATQTSDSAGNAVLDVGRGVPQTIRVEATNYLRQTRVFTLSETTTTGFIDVSMAYAPSEQTLAKIENGGTLTASNGSKLELPPGALVDAAGNAVTGDVKVRVAPIDVVNDVLSFPGRFSGIDTTGAPGQLLSWGTVDYTFTQGGNPLNLAPDKQAMIEIPVFAGLSSDGQAVKEGDIYPLWSLDEDTGVWVQEGLGTVTASLQSPTGFVLRGSVGHFSWWNCDRFDDTYQGSGGCCIDSNFDGACDGPTMCYVRGRTNCTGSICSTRANDAPPAYLAETVIASGETQTLLMPVAYPVRLEGYADNGLNYGKQVISGLKGEQKTFNLVLQPLPVAQPSQVITLPHDANYASPPANTFAVFEFDLQQAQVVLMQVERGAGSALNGDIRFFAPGGTTPLKTATFNAATGEIAMAASANGRYRLEVEPTYNAPGGMHLVVMVIGEAPYLTARTPALDAVGVSPTTTISATFNTAINATTVGGGFKVFSPLGVEVVGQRVVNDKTVTFTPDVALTPGGFYRVQLTTNIKSATNFNLAADVEWLFTTQEQIGVGMAIGNGVNPYLEPFTGGKVMVAYYDSNGIYANVYTPGSGVGFPDTLFAGSSVYRKLGGNDANDLMLVWTYTNSENANKSELWARRFRPDKGWLEPTKVATGETSETLSDIDVDVDSAGVAVVTYKIQGPSPYSLWATRQPRGGAFTTPVRLDEGPNCGAGFPSNLTVAPTGDAVIAWNPSTNVCTAIYDAATGAWLAPESQGNNQNSMRITQMDAAGNAYLSWADGLDVLHARRRSVGAASVWSAPFDVPSSYTNNCRATFDVSPSGVAYITFCEHPGNYINRTMRWSDEDDGDAGGVNFSVWSTPLTILDDAAGSIQIAGVAPDGSYDLVWKRGGTDVFYTPFAPGSLPGTAPAASTLADANSIGNDNNYGMSDDTLSTNDFALWAHSQSGVILYRLR